MAAEPEKRDITKRRVKDPETFRQRAIKAAEAGDRPSSKHRLRAAGNKAVRPVTKPVGGLLNKIFNRQPFIFISKILVPPYFRNSWRELKQVSWPSFREARQLTVAVMLFAIVFGGIVAGVDYGLDKLFRHVLLSK